LELVPVTEFSKVDRYKVDRYKVDRYLGV